jgi:perosamine synthetase
MISGPASSNSDGGLRIPDWPVTDDAIRAVFAAMLEDGSWGRYHGPHCNALRAELASYHSIEHVLLTSSGTAAVEIALRAVSAGQGDEVILSAYDFKANFINVLTVGATPVLIDTLTDQPVINVDQIESAISDRTRAILVSHLHGSLVPMQRVCEIAKDRGLLVIEDACQCPGAVLNGKRAGTLGDVGILSFGGSKLLTAGRGGAVLSNNATIAQRARLWTQRGNDASPLSEMQSAVLLPQLRTLDSMNALRHRRVKQLRRLLDDSPLQLSSQLPDLDDSNTANSTSVPAWYKLPFLFRNQQHSAMREVICRKLRESGVPLDPALPALHRIHSRSRFRAVGQLSNATRLNETLMTLHHTALLYEENQLPVVAEIVRTQCELLNG